MWTKPGFGTALDPSRVVVGLYVFIDLRWDEHPFLSNRLMVETPKDVAILKSLNLQGKLFYYPEKSRVTLPPFSTDPLPAAETPAEAEALPEPAALEAERLALAEAKQAKRRKQRDAAQRAERLWEQAARKTKEALHTLNRSPKVAGELLAGLSRETAAAIVSGQDVLLHLLGDKVEVGPQFHALNVLTLCMLLGKRMALSEPELVDLAMAALAHDAGQGQVPTPILKAAQRKKHEEEFFRQHVKFSVEVARLSGAFSREALAMIADHHEAADGTGWPRGHAGLSRGARILAAVNRYDNLCSPQAAGAEPLMPAEALARMFRQEGTRLDKDVLALMIKLLGVYPPGTVVQLSDGALAMVVTPGPNSLQPQVLLYEPELAKEEAPTIELHTEPGLKITEAIKPSSLPAEVRTWLNPQQRLSYFFSVERDPA
jgi:HD-GYP domain-containing protein (c-di-GMP phosphodiesterase class II)